MQWIKSPLPYNEAGRVLGIEKVEDEINYQAG